jgi:heat shock protein HslJ
MSDTSTPRALRPWRALAWALPALALSLAACAGGAQPGSLVGTEWRLVELDGKTLPERPAATLAFTEPGKVAGSGSCNRYFGSVSVSGDRIGFSQVGATKMACMGPAGDLEPRYFAALQQAQRYELKDSQLLIHVQGQTAPLRFVRTQR